MILVLAVIGASRELRESAAGPQRDTVATEGPGFRVLEGKHLTLVTDLPPHPAVDELPAVFDQAVDQWCEYFEIPRSSAETWHVRGFLMRHRERFQQAGWLPDSVPAFPHGFQRGDQIWVLEQPSDYYSRHLLLHEGTHAFMGRWLGGAGPPWFMEGMAELLGTHRLQEGRLTLGVIPAAKQDVPEWGRIRLIRDAVAAGQERSLNQVLAMPPREFIGDVEAYAWSWAAATLLNGHPQWRERFRGLMARAAWDHTRFQHQFAIDFEPDRAELDQAWSLLLHQLDYGYDVAEDRVIEGPAALWQGRATARVDSRLGWQSTGLRLDGERRYRISARGRFRLNQLSPAWFSEAGGITIRYYQGRPLGMLLGAVRPQGGSERTTALVDPRPLGLSAEWTPKHSGVLFLRINEPAGKLADNQGQLEVEIEEIMEP